MYPTLDYIQDLSLSNLSAALQETRAQQFRKQHQHQVEGSCGNTAPSAQTSFFSQWDNNDSINTTSLLSGLDMGKNPSSQDMVMNFDLDLDPLNQSTTSDKFGLNSSNSSTGLHLADMVTKIVDDDAKFGMNDFTGQDVDKSRPSSDIFSFDR